MATLRSIVPDSMIGRIPDEDRDTEIKLGWYQVSVIHGSAAWSGADLKGRAKRYGDIYKRSRKSALAKVRKIVSRYGLDLVVSKGPHGKLSLVWITT